MAWVVSRQTAEMVPKMRHSAERIVPARLSASATTRSSRPVAAIPATSPMSRRVKTDTPTARSMPSTTRPPAVNRSGSTKKTSSGRSRPSARPSSAAPAIPASSPSSRCRRASSRPITSAGARTIGRPAGEAAARSASPPVAGGPIEPLAPSR